MNRLYQIFRKIYCIVYYALTYFSYGKSHYTNYIAPSSTVVNKKQKKIGRYFVLRPFSQLRGDFKCGDHVRFGYGCQVFGGVEMGNHIMVAPNCLITSGGHGTELSKGPMIFQKCPSQKKVIIEDDVWIGGNTVILPGVRIGKGAVIGAGSVVSKDVPPNAIAVGNPAKVVKYRE
jgi:maltose O-acetyltransferase